MKVSELSEKSGIPLPTIKFYIREGLLPPGARTAKNQADYGPSHLERLALIRSLRDDAGLGIDAIARALAAADTAKQDFVVAAIDALERPTTMPVDARSAAFKRALQAILGIAEKQGWQVAGSDLSVREAARSLAVIERAFPDEDEASLEPYFAAASLIAEHEIPPDWAPDESPGEALRYALLGTVLFEPLILALRRMAHVARARKVQTGGASHSKARAHKKAPRNGQ